ncbi:hypothetical protein BDEG_28728 [Batrachochytrium dendrobatidis JEL423]|uniref:Uncharacterized protein n=1 Tax=Batrachochytrium dendrobatidis (strain JEL423) TaxID=403673 RepID=A0A177W0B3_BATDL|nr:hypothetical protein BDEG_28728 [Batrachochytrium dendrobatidis JEL423]
MTGHIWFAQQYGLYNDHCQDVHVKCVYNQVDDIDQLTHADQRNCHFHIAMRHYFEPNLLSYLVTYCPTLEWKRMGDAQSTSHKQLSAQLSISPTSITDHCMNGYPFKVALTPTISLGTAIRGTCF